MGGGGGGAGKFQGGGSDLKGTNKISWAEGRVVGCTFLASS